MSHYVDGFVLPIPKKNIKKYVAMAKIAGEVWMEHGALDYYECVADDVKPGKVTSFPQSVKLKKDEVVFFSWIVYKSRKDRDTILKKVMADERITCMGPETMPFDGKRMFWGGFQQMVTTDMVKKKSGKKSTAKKSGPKAVKKTVKKVVKKTLKKKAAKK